MTAGLENLPQFMCEEGAVMAEDTLCSASLAAAPCSAVALGDMRLLQSEPRRASPWRGATQAQVLLCFVTQPLLHGHRE